MINHFIKSNFDLMEYFNLYFIDSKFKYFTNYFIYINYFIVIYFNCFIIVYFNCFIVIYFIKYLNYFNCFIDCFIDCYINYFID